MNFFAKKKGKTTTICFREYGFYCEEKQLIC